VLNLASGLDSRPFRLDLPHEVRWIDVDLPGILEYKAAKLAGHAPKCRYETVVMDLSQVEKRRELFRRVGSESKNALVIAEGFLVYLTREQVVSLSSDLLAETSFRSWITQIIQPRFVKLMTLYWGDLVARANAPFKFSAAEGPRFFEPLGWRVADYLSGHEQARRLGIKLAAMPLSMTLPLFVPLPFFIEEFRYKHGGSVLLERK